MERSEPSLAPEWLRSNGGGTGVGSSSHHFASSQADVPVLALPKRNRSSKSNGSSDVLHSSILERSSSSNSRRSSSSNGSCKHDKNSYSRSYSSFNRNQRDRDRERLNVADNWDLEYSDPLRSMITGRNEDTLRRSQSMISRKQGEVQQRRMSTELRNGSHNNQDNGNGTHLVGNSAPGVQKVSFEKDFPVLGSDERPRTPDIIRVSSPGLSRGVQSLSIANSPLLGGESWTSALAEVPTGSNGNGSSPTLQPLATASNAVPGAGSTSPALNMAEALVQAPTRPQNVQQPSVQVQREELAIAQSKKLIPMTPVLPKTLVNSSDKLKPKTSGRASDGMVAPKNGMQQLAPLQLGSQSVRGTNARVDSPKSPSSGRLLVLKPVREKGVSPVVKDVQGQTTNVNNSVASGHSATAPSVASVPLKNSINPKLCSGERKPSGVGLNPGSVVDKRYQSRNDFFNLVRKKSMNTSGTADSGTALSSDMVGKSDKEVKGMPNAEVIPPEMGTEVKRNGETCTAAVSFSHFTEDDYAFIYPTEEERELLRSLGWEEEDDGEKFEAITEEEISAFCQRVLTDSRATAKLCRGLWPKILSHFELRAACSGAASTEPSASASQTEA